MGSKRDKRTKSAPPDETADPAAWPATTMRWGRVARGQAVLGVGAGLLIMAAGQLPRLWRGPLGDAETVTARMWLDHLIGGSGGWFTPTLVIASALLVVIGFLIAARGWLPGLRGEGFERNVGTGLSVRQMRSTGYLCGVLGVGGMAAIAVGLSGPPWRYDGSDAWYGVLVGPGVLLAAFWAGAVLVAAHGAGVLLRLRRVRPEGEVVEQPYKETGPRTLLYWSTLLMGVGLLGGFSFPLFYASELLMLGIPPNAVPLPVGAGWWDALFDEPMALIGWAGTWGSTLLVLAGAAGTAAALMGGRRGSAPMSRPRECFRHAAAACGIGLATLGGIGRLQIEFPAVRRGGDDVWHAWLAAPAVVMALPILASLVALVVGGVAALALHGVREDDFEEGKRRGVEGPAAGPA